MGIDITELRKKIEDQMFRWNSAKSNGTMVNQETERMKNILINNVSEIVIALQACENSAQQIMELEAEVASTDAELKEQDEELKKLRKQTGKGKPMAKGEPDVE